MVKMKKSVALFAFILIICVPVFAQHEHQHADSSEQESSVVMEEGLPEKSEIPGTRASSFAPFSEFPNLHPLIVHFPVVLLLLAFFAQIIGLFAWRTELSWVTFFLLIGGFAGAFLAAKVFHPHVGELSERLNHIFEAHEYYAYATVWLSGIAFFLKAISHFFLKRKTWAEIIVFLSIMSSAITVSLAGHLGSQMVFIENIGPQGNHLEEGAHGGEGHEHQD